MNAARLINLIEAPDSIKGTDLDDLGNLLKKHPFFGIGHILYLNGLKHSDEGLYNHHLNKSAVRIADRSVLYRLVNHVDLASNDPVILDEKVLEKENQTTETQKSIASRNTSSEEPIPVAPQDHPALNVDSPIKTSKVSLDDIFAGVHDDIDEEDFVVPFVPEDVVSTKSLDTPVKVDVPEITTETAKIEVETEDAVSTPAQEKSPIRIEPASKLENTEPRMPSKQMNLGSFNSWLKQHLDQKQAEGTSVKESDKSSLIDKFIETEPKISKPKPEFYTPQAMSKKSVIDNESIVSETLAKIYADQGDYDKAISAYKKMSLEKPEKSTYFAALIYELELKQSLE